MIEKYTISFSVEAEFEDKEELAAMIWTLLKIGKQAYGPMPMTVPSLKEINVEVGFCDEPYQPLRLFLLPYMNTHITEDMVPTCTAARFRDLSDAIGDYKAQGKIIMVVYVPKGTKPSEGRRVCVYRFSPTSGSYEDCGFFREHPDLA